MVVNNYEENEGILQRVGAGGEDMDVGGDREAGSWDGAAGGGDNSWGQAAGGEDGGWGQAGDAASNL